MFILIIMDEIEKHRRLCAIHIAIKSNNHRCAEMVFNDSVREELRELVTKIYETALTFEQTQFIDEIQPLIQDYLN